MKQKRLILRSIGIAVVASVFLLLSVYLCINRVHRQMRAEVLENLEDVVSQNTLAVNNEIYNNFRMLFGVSRQLQGGGYSSREILETAQHFVDLYGLKRIGFIQPTGMADTTDGYHVDLSSRSFFGEGMRGESRISGPYMDLIDDSTDSITVFSTPVFAENDEVMGVLFATYPAAQLERVFSLEAFGGIGYSLVADQDGNLLVYSMCLGEVVNSQEMRDGLVQLFSGNYPKKGTFLDNGEEMYYCYTPLSVNAQSKRWYTLTLVTGELLDKRMEPIETSVNMLAVLVVAIVLAGAGVLLVMDQRRRKELERLAYQDSLTKGNNFTSFKEKMRQMKKREGYLVAVDISEFKIINAICGVTKANQVILRVWEILQENLKEGELAGRVHGDSFIFFLQGDKKQELAARIERVTFQIEGIAQELEVPRVFPVFGIYRTNSQCETEQAHGHAIQAKEMIKGRRDRHYVFFDELDPKKLWEEKCLSDDFERALKQGEFHVWYQPKVSCPDGKLRGFEALIRWQRPSGEILCPGKFIPIFEQNGNIVKLDEYMFGQVCKLQKQWESSGKEMVPVSVNISRVSLYFGNIVKRYKNIASKYAIDPKYIQLEITESATIDNLEIGDLMQQFRDAGFSILLDDFGSGYSSLSTLNTMLFDVIKLDKSLIDYIGDENGEKLLYHVTKLAQSLGMEITAEGVETKEQVDFLQQLHCDEIQGYFYSKPLPVDQAKEFSDKDKEEE